jgi:hypothetical protein
MQFYYFDNFFPNRCFSSSPKKSNQKKAPCHDPFGFACLSELRPNAPKLAPRIAGLKQSPRFIRPQPP